MGLAFRVLGPLRVRRDDVDVELGGPRQHRLLLLLLLNGRDGVSDDRIVADLLAADDVRRPEATLRTYVSRLRHALDTPGDGQPTRVERLAAGYRLRVEDGELDAATFDVLASWGLRQLEHGDDPGAAQTLAEASVLWAGPPYAEVADEPFAAAEIERLRRTHASVRVGLADARLRMGQVSDVISHLVELAAQEPFQEAVVERLMVAYYVAGDPGAALDVFAHFRDRLADELGLDPGRELVELHRRILQRDPDLGLEDVVGWSLRGYRMHAPLGTGRFGTVYAARLPEVDRDYAVRVYRADVADDPQALRSFEARARSLSVIDDPGLVRVFDAWREPGLAALVMRRLTGQTLQDRLDADSVSPELSVAIVEQVGGALSTLHAHGITHGRVRPSSVLFDEHDNCYLADAELQPAPGSSDSADFIRLTRTVLDAVGDPDGVLDSLDGLAAIPLQDVDAAVAEVFRQLRAPAPTTNPYVGLRAFEEVDAHLFFGRTRMVDQVLAAVVGAGGPRLVLVVGGSGSGKSSVVRAGVIPRLREDDWLVTSMVPGSGPFDNLDHALRRLATTSRDAPCVDAADPVSLGRAVSHIVPEGNRMMLVVDQLEELFSLSPRSARDAFLSALATACTTAGVPLHVVATLRGDFYDRPLEHPTFGRLAGSATIAVPAMTDAEVTEAIEGPAGQAMLELDAGLVDQLRGGVLGDPTALPALQFTLHALASRGSRHLGTADLADIGGVAGAIAARAEQVYSAMSADNRDLFRRMIERLVVVEPSGGPSRRRATRMELVSMATAASTADEVLESAIRARLLVADHRQDTREPTVELAHEAILTRWPRLRAWIDADRERLLATSRLEQDASAWNDVDHDPAALLRGARLERAEALVAASETPPAIVRDYVDASVAQRDAEDRAASAAAQEKSRAAHRMRRQRALLAAALVVAVALGGLAVVQAGVAQRNAIAAQARAQAATAGLLAAADDAAESDWSLALLLAAEAHQISDTPLTRRGLVGALVDRKPQPTVLHEAGQALSTLDLDAQTGAVAVRTLADTVDVVDGGTGGVLAEGLPVAPMTGRGGLDVSEDLVAVGGGATDGGETIVYRIGSDEPIARLPWPGLVADVQFSPDGQQLASAGEGGLVRIYSTSDWGTERTLAGDSGKGLDTVAWSADGTRIYSGDLAGEMYLWDLAASDADPQPSDARLLLPDNNTIGSGPSDILPVPGTNTIFVSQFEFASYLLDTRDLSIVAGPFRGAWAASIDPDGRALATAHNSSAVVRSLDEGTWTDVDPASLAVLRRDVNDVAFDADGSLVTAGGEGTVLRWDLDPPQPGMERLPGVATGQPAFSPDGELMVMNSWFAPFQVFTTGDYDVVAELDAGPVGSTNRLGPAFQPERGRVVVSYCPDTPPDSWDKCSAQVAAFDTATGERVAGPVEQGSVMGNTYPSVVVVDGEVVATGEVGGVVTLRDAESLEPVQVLRDTLGSPESDRAYLQASADGSLLLARLDPAGRSTLWAVSDSRASVVRTFPTAAAHLMPDNTVVVGSAGGWSVVDARSGDTVTEMDVPTGIFALSFTSDGRWMGLADGNGDGWIWSLEDMAPVAGPFSMGWWGAAIEPDAGHLLVAAPDSMHRFPLDPGAWRAMACDAAGRNLSEAEWERYFPDEPYRTTCPNIDVAS